MCCMNTGYSANTGMINQLYGMRRTGYYQGMAGMYNQGTAGMYNRGTAGMYGSNIRGTYTCSTVNVIDMGGMITRRIECRPLYNQSMPFRVMYQSML